MQPVKPPRRKSLLPNIDRFCDRHGHMRYSYRVGKGPRTPIVGKFGSDEFMASYMAIANGLTGADRPVVALRSTGRSVAMLIAHYKANNLQFKANRDGTTKKGYTSRLKAMDRDYGDYAVSNLTRERIIEWLDEYDDKPGAGLDTHKKLKILIKHAMDIGWMTGDPMVGLKRPKGGSIRPWTEDEVEQFKERWPLGTRQHLAMTLTEFLGQRRSDTHRMGWHDINPRTGRIKVVQQKTDAKLEIPIHEELLYVLDAAHAQRGSVINISDPKSRPRRAPHSRLPGSLTGFGMPSRRRTCRWTASPMAFAI